MNLRPDPMDDDPPTMLANPAFWITVLTVLAAWSLVIALGWLLSMGSPS